MKSNKMQPLIYSNALMDCGRDGLTNFGMYSWIYCKAFGDSGRDFLTNFGMYSWIFSKPSGTGGLFLTDFGRYVASTCGHDR